MKNLFTNVFAKIFILFVALSVSAHAGRGSCDSMCGINSSNAKNMIQDPTCKASESCTSCVVNALTTSQSGAYCSAYNDSKKGKTGQTINASLNVAATVVCGVACAMSLNIITAGASPHWDRACGYTGLAVTAAEVGYTISNLAKGDGDLLSLATTAVGARNSVQGIKAANTAIKMSKEIAKEGAEATATATSNTSKAACWNVVTFGIAAAAKIASISKMSQTKDKSCDMANSLASVAGGAVQSCLAQSKIPAGPSGSTAQGLFAATAETFPIPKLDDVNRLTATSAQDKYLKELQNELALGEKEGKFNLADIAKRIDSGESASSILSGSGIPADSLAQIKAAEERIAKGDNSKLLAHIMGGGYTGGEGGAVAADGAGGMSEMAFGEASSPGEGAASLEIDRKPAEAPASLLVDGDVFHASFPGTIFDIVSLRIKDQKSSYAELEPEGRMNRVFNGYSDPKLQTKMQKTRKPAGK